MNKARILMVDDDTDLLRLFGIRLESEGYEVATAESADRALNCIDRQRPHVVITDLRMAGMDGMELLSVLRGKDATLPVIIMTAHGTIPDAVEATKCGAFGFVTKPVDTTGLLREIEKALRTYRATEISDDPRTELVTRNPALKDLVAKASRAAASGVPILLTGESGTGKELVARHVHAASGRKGRFVPVNCSAIPGDLLESELFGHERGAFTGADSARVGLIRAADGGTLFLDEIGDMPVALQAKVLRVLEESCVRPVGGTEEVAVEFQVVSATNRDLDEAVADGSFRQDLLYRLNVLPLAIPPLRSRPEDIPLLAEYFLDAIAGRDGEARRVFAPAAMELLTCSSWPGNVRELRNLVHRTHALSSGSVITANQVREALGDAPEPRSYDHARDEFTRQYLVQLLQITGGNVSRAARLAERNRTDFHKLLKRHGVEAAQFKHA